MTPWTVDHQLLCPWGSPGKNTGVGSHFLLQGIFPTQGENLFLHWQAGSLPAEPLGGPLDSTEYIIVVILVILKTRAKTVMIRPLNILITFIKVHSSLTN